MKVRDMITYTELVAQADRKGWSLAPLADFLGLIADSRDEAQAAEGESAMRGLAERGAPLPRLSLYDRDALENWMGRR